MKQQHKVAAIVLAGVVGAGGAVVSPALADPGHRAKAPAPAAPAAAVHAKGKVTAHRLAVRPRPNTHNKPLYWLKRGQVVGIRCFVRGQDIKGNDKWYRLRTERREYSSARYIKIIQGTVKHC
ncbi:hypothetical protein [Actinomadura terrae]|uniref:hypothetical protein n=1 Tax=Actinomadura terrae TaxID=604353 RepID=UPI001FA7D1FD|nr:hypothetical protein [Actinomadura terrae]